MTTIQISKRLKVADLLKFLLIFSLLCPYFVAPDMTNSMTAEASLPAAPVNLDFTIVDNKPRLTWDAVPDALSYNVYVRGIKVASSVFSTSHTLDVSTWKLDRLYKVQISAVKAVGEGPLSTHKLVYKPAISSVRMVDAGGFHSAALKSDGTVIAWGTGPYTGGDDVPVGLNNVIAISAGGTHNLALKKDGTVVGWRKSTGGFQHGQAVVPTGLNDVVQIFTGTLNSYAMKSDGTLIGWGLNATVPQGISNIRDLVSGESHTLVIKDDGTVTGWGSNSSGQLNIPSGLTNVVAIGAGFNNSVAVKADGTVVGWGDQSSYGLTPPPQGISGVVDVTSRGYGHVTALKSDGTVIGWGVTSGSNHFGQNSIPVGLNNVWGIAGGFWHSFAFKKDGTIVAFGAGQTNSGSWPHYGQSIVPLSFGSPETTPPSVPTNLAATDITATGFKVSWDPSTDNSAVEGYEVYRNGTLVGTTATNSFSFTGLTQLTNYNIEVLAYDAAANKSAKSTSLTVKTGDGTPPSVPSGLTASNITSSSFSVSWTASTDNVGVSGYQVFLNNSLVGTTNLTNFSFTGLDNAATYTVTVKAFDNLNNTSLSSQPLNVTTLSQAQNDTTAPTAPTNLAASDVTATTLKLTWTASTDNVGVAVYDVYQGTSKIGTVSAPTTTYNVTGLTAGTSYTYTVKAVDAAGNASSASNAVSVTTSTGNVAPTAIGLSSNKMPENVWVDYEIGTFTSVDANEEDTFTYSLVSGEGSDDNANFAIVGDTLEAAIVFDFAEQETHLIRVRTMDSGGLSYEQAFEIEVTQGNVTLNATNKVATIHFDDTIFDNSSSIEVPESEPKKTLKQLITITNEADEEDPEYSPLGTNDTVAIKKNTIVITFANQITGVYNRIKIAEEALKDRFNYISGEQITTPLVVDVDGPKLIKSTMDKKKKKITLRFSEKIYMATAGAKPADVAVSFKNAVTFKRGSGSFSALAAKDKVSVSGREVVITLATALTTNDNQVRFAAEALRDLLSNKSLAITSAEIEDTTGPVLNKVTLGADNKTVTIAFDEEAFNATTGTKTVKEAALRAAVTFAADGATFGALGTTDTIELKSGIITVKFASALSGSTNRIRIAGDALQDLFAIKNNTLTTSSIIADSVGPVCKTPDEDDADLCASTALPSKNLNARLTITLNEKVTAVDKKLVKNAVTLSTNGTYAALGTSDKVTTSKNQIVVTFAKPLVATKDGVAQEYQVKVAAGAVKDFFGNQNLEIETVTFAVDTSGPKLR